MENVMQLSCPSPKTEYGTFKTPRALKAAGGKRLCKPVVISEANAGIPALHRGSSRGLREAHDFINKLSCLTSLKLAFVICTAPGTVVIIDLNTLGVEVS